MIVFWFLSFPILITSRYVVKKMLIKLRLWQIPVILVGAGKTAELILAAFERDSGLGYEVVGLIDDNLQREAIFQQYPLIGTFSTAEETIAQTGIKDVLIAAPGLAREELSQLIYRIQPYIDNIVLMPSGTVLIDNNLSLVYIGLRVTANAKKC